MGCLNLVSLAVVLTFVQAAPVSRGIVEWKPGQFGESPPRGLTVAGSPKAVESPFGKAIRFDGKGDGIFLATNPIEGLSEFTIEAVFYPDSDGPPEQRFVHFGYAMGDRVLLETRITSDGQWYLDTFILGGKEGKPLVDAKLVHPTGRWYHAAFVVRDGHLANYVNGVLELEGRIDYTAFRGGETSIGVRLNRRSWFKGSIYSVRITPKALAPEEFTLSKPAAK